MKLSNDEGDYLQLTIEGYEFPDNTTCFLDSNWLTIVGRVCLGKKQWSFRDPCLLNWEGLRLVEWVKDIAEELPTESQIDFIEPELEFKLTSAGSVRIYFEFGARPNWAPYDGFMEDLFIELNPICTDLKGAADCFQRQLDRFPVRALAQY